MSDWPYYTARWQRVRARQLARHPLCVPCLLEGKVTGASHVDHIKPISQGGEVWNPENLQSLCPSHHSLKTQSFDRLGKDWTQWERRGCNADGTPRDPSHPWHKGHLKL